jgi:hypothetical protein
MEHDLSHYSVVAVQHNRTGRDYWFFLRKGSQLSIRTDSFERGHLNTSELMKMSDFVFGREGWQFSYTLMKSISSDSEAAMKLLSDHLTRSKQSIC